MANFTDTEIEYLGYRDAEGVWNPNSQIAHMIPDMHPKLKHYYARSWVFYDQLSLENKDLFGLTRKNFHERKCNEEPKFELSGSEELTVFFNSANKTVTESPVGPIILTLWEYLECVRIGRSVSLPAHDFMWLNERGWVGMPEHSTTNEILQKLLQIKDESNAWIAKCPISVDCGTLKKNVELSTKKQDYFYEWASIEEHEALVEKLPIAKFWSSGNGNAPWNYQPKKVVGLGKHRLFLCGVGTGSGASIRIAPDNGTDEYAVSMSDSCNISDADPSEEVGGLDLCYAYMGLGVKEPEHFDLLMSLINV